MFLHLEANTNIGNTQSHLSYSINVWHKLLCMIIQCCSKKMDSTISAPLTRLPGWPFFKAPVFLFVFLPTDGQDQPDQFPSASKGEIVQFDDGAHCHGNCKKCQSRKLCVLTMTLGTRLTVCVCVLI